MNLKWKLSLTGRQRDTKINYNSGQARPFRDDYKYGTAYFTVFII